MFSRLGLLTSGACPSWLVSGSTRQLARLVKSAVDRARAVWCSWTVTGRLTPRRAALVASPPGCCRAHRFAGGSCNGRATVGSFRVRSADWWRRVTVTAGLWNEVLPARVVVGLAVRPHLHGAPLVLAMIGGGLVAGALFFGVVYLTTRALRPGGK